MAVAMKLIPKCRLESQFFEFRKNVHYIFLRSFCQAPNSENPEEPQFRVMKLKPEPEAPTKERPTKIIPSPPRTLKMPVNQEWSNVWPGPKTFHPASVPLPLRQGFNKKRAPLPKECNAELMKIPNFLHLTPPAIEKHCRALKRFCTPWPKKLETDKDMEEHFPIEIIYSDYCHSGPSIRNPLSRIITLRFKLSALKFDTHSKDKFLRLVGKRYDEVTDYVTITTDSCPLKKQNYDYAHYLLTALYFESWKFEDWEKEKGDDDMEYYDFEHRISMKNLKKYFEYNKRDMPDVKYFGQRVNEWHDNGDSPQTVENYKQAALQLLDLPPLEKAAQAN